MTILILSNKWDISVDYVVKTLRERSVEYSRLNTEDLVSLDSTFSTSPYSYVVHGQQTIDFHDVTSILLRRPGKPFEFIAENAKPSDTVANIVAEQWSKFLSGLQALTNILWINHPQKNEFAESKINQMIEAERLGLQIPKTCVTSSKTALSEFWSECNGRVIAKALYAPLIRESGKDFFVFSNRIACPDEIKHDELPFPR